MHVKKGDTVQVIAGYEKGQVGEVKEVSDATFALPSSDKQSQADGYTLVQVLTKVGKVVVTGVNMRVSLRIHRAVCSGLTSGLIRLT